MFSPLPICLECVWKSKKKSIIADEGWAAVSYPQLGMLSHTCLPELMSGENI